MRSNRLVAAAALLLAGCGPGQNSAEIGRNEAAAAPAAPSRPKSAAMPSLPVPNRAEGKSIPAAFHGVYDASAEACGRPGDGRLAVTATGLRFHESLGSVRSVTSQSPGLIRVEADYQGEGERWRNSHELRLSKDGANLRVTGDGTSFDRVRCAEGGR